MRLIDEILGVTVKKMFTDYCDGTYTYYDDGEDVPLYMEVDDAYLVKTYGGKIAA